MFSTILAMNSKVICEPESKYCFVTLSTIRIQWGVPFLIQYIKKEWDGTKFPRSSKPPSWFSIPTLKISLDFD